MKVEVLFPEICNLYGELENIKYLKKSCPHIEVIETAINDRPLLVSETPDLIYMGTMTESSQQLAIRQLSGYRPVSYTHLQICTSGMYKVSMLRR